MVTRRALENEEPGRAATVSEPSLLKHRQRGDVEEVRMFDCDLGVTKGSRQQSDMNVLGPNGLSGVGRSRDGSHHQREGRRGCTPRLG